MAHVFISYVRDDSERAERLSRSLQAHGVEVWLDKYAIQPGADWQESIRTAISEGKFFIACFSENYRSRDRTHMNEELTLAIEELRLRPRDRTWFIPVLFSGVVPDWDIGAGKTLRSLQWLDLGESDWDSAVRRLVAVIRGDVTRPLDEARIEALAALLDSPSVNDRLSAVEQLNELTGSEAVLPHLAKALADPATDVGYGACLGLSTFGSTAVPILVEALENEAVPMDTRLTIVGTFHSLRDKAAAAVPALIRLVEARTDPFVHHALAALGQIAQPADRIVPVLVDLLTSGDSVLRTLAVEALERIDSPAAVEAARAYTTAADRRKALNELAGLLDEDDDATRTRAMDAVVAAGEDAIPSLIERLEWGSHGAAAALRRIGEPVTPALAALLEDATFRNRGAAASVLGEIGDATAVSALIRAVRADDFDVRSVITALGQIDHADAIPTLVDSLAEYDEAARALVQIGAVAVPALIEASAPASPRKVRILALTALGEIRDASARSVLADALHDPGTDVRDAAAVALRRVGADASLTPRLVAALREDRGTVPECAEALLSDIGEPAVEPLLESFSDAEAPARERAGRVLAAIGSPRVIERMMEIVRDDLASSAEHEAAVAVAARIGKPAIDVLIEAVARDDPMLSYHAAEALGEIRSPAAIPVLMDLLRAERNGYNDAVPTALGRIGGPAIQDLIEELTREAQTNVQAYVATALKVAGDVALPDLFPLLRHPIERVRYLVTGILARSTDPRVVPSLILAFEDVDTSTRRAICDALGRIEDPGVLPFLKQALNDEDESVARHACDALAQIDTREAREAVHAYRSRTSAT